MTDWQTLTETTLKTWVQTQRLGIITDVDGTLSPIVSQPEAAQVTERNKALLSALLDHTVLVAAVSGRTALDIHDRVGVAGMVYVGNHGLERWQEGGVISPPEVMAHRPHIANAYDNLQKLIAPYAGMRIEDKGPTLTVHYRNVDNPEAVAEAFRPQVQAVVDQYNLALHEGRMIFEIRPPLALNKGTAFRTLVNEYALEAAIYLGDDVTDIDAIQAARSLREAGECLAYGLGVDSTETPLPVLEAADFAASGVPGVEAFLGWVLSARRASSN